MDQDELRNQHASDYHFLRAMDQDELKNQQYIFERCEENFYLFTNEVLSIIEKHEDDFIGMHPSIRQGIPAGGKRSRTYSRAKAILRSLANARISIVAIMGLVCYRRVTHTGIVNHLNDDAYDGRDATTPIS